MQAIPLLLMLGCLGGPVPFYPEQFRACISCMTGPRIGDHKLYEPVPVTCWFVLFCEEENGARWSLGTEKNVLASTITTPRDATVYCLRACDLDGDGDLDLRDLWANLGGGGH